MFIARYYRGEKSSGSVTEKLTLEFIEHQERKNDTSILARKFDLEVVRLIPCSLVIEIHYMRKSAVIILLN